VRADREPPVVWAAAKGSFVNKVILVPAALAISAFLPWLIGPLLMLGGAYLCYEGVEKCMHRWLHLKADLEKDHQQQSIAVKDAKADMLAFEKDKIKGAVRTDFVLSAEIVVITLGTVQQMNFLSQVMVVSLIALLMTVGVYGFVAGIVKFDDLGFYLIRQSKQKTLKMSLGEAFVATVPKVLQALTYIGTLAMFLVGGGILVHGLPFLHHTYSHFEACLELASKYSFFWCRI
jgi:predicted DNA repair protein MutK